MLNKLNFFLLLILAMHILVFSQFAGGAGTEEDPWQIRTPENLDSIRHFTGIDNIFFKQIEDINLGVSPWVDGEGWIPIGNAGSPFMGSYECYESYYFWDGYIRNLTINDSTLDNAGLFGVINNADLDSIRLYNVSIIGNNSCGALAGSATGSRINNCSVISGDITGAEEVGGLIGSSWHNTINQSISSHPNFLLNVIGNINVGGFAGVSCSTVKDCYSQSNVSGDSLVGGFVGTHYDSTITNCYSTGVVKGGSSTGGFSSQGTPDLIISCYWSTDASGQTTSSGGEGKTSMEMFSSYTYVGWDFEKIWRPRSDKIQFGYPFLQWQQDVGIEEHDAILPNTVKLEQNYPNPFNPSTKITYSIPNGYYDNVKLQIFNTKGELVKRLVNQKQGAGKYSIEFNASNLNSGMYFYSLKTLNSATTKKMILLK